MFVYNMSLLLFVHAYLFIYHPVRFVVCLTEKDEDKKEFLSFPVFFSLLFFVPSPLLYCLFITSCFGYASFIYRLSFCGLYSA